MEKNLTGRACSLVRRAACALMALVCLGVTADPATGVTSVTARQRYPWNGLVDIDVTFSAGGLSTVSFEVTDTVGNTNLNARTFYLGNPEQNVRTLDILPGTHRFVWDAAADLGEVTIPAFSVAARVQEKYFEVNVTGGTGAGTYREGSSVAIAAGKTGYTFADWSGTEADVALLESATAATTTFAVPGRDVAYEATYTPNTFTVKFNANGGTGTMANEPFTYDVAKALTANAFTRTGYNFQGWATSASGAKVYNDKQSVSNLAQTSGTVVNLYAVWKPRLYMVINLSSGSSATSYPISYLDAVPDGGWADIHKTTRLILRLVEAGTFVMGDNQTDESHRVTLTKPFYIGVFEMTQRQYELVTGSNPCSSTTYGNGNTYPVHYVSYDMIRGTSNGAKWPASSAVDSSSFVGKLRARTGLDFDLPTEAQWEYACRAGTTTTYYWGNSMNGNYAWYADNSGDKTHPVGGKTANAWGLYDMSGNVSEWCLDWYGTLAYGTDPKGSSSGTIRLRRSGSWNNSSNYCTSYARTANGAPSNANSVKGFRLCLPLSN